MYDKNVAVAGAGFIGPVHVEALRRLGVNVSGIAGSNPDASAAAAEALRLPKAYGTFDDLIADKSVGAVHLAVPNVLHYSMAKQALEAGKHVMCEKPLAMTTAETAELVELAASSGLAAGVCYNLRYYPLNIEARARIAAGSLGEVYSIEGSYVQDWLLYDTDYNWRVLADKGGALRAVADIGTHWLDLVQAVTGLKVEAVFADLQTVHAVRHKPVGEVKTFTGDADKPNATEEIDIDTEDAGSILLRFGGGARGCLHVSQITAGRKNCLRYEISGESAALAFDAQRPNELWIGHRNEANEVLVKDPGLLGDVARPYANYPGGHNEGFPDSFKQLFRAFYGAIVAGTPGAAAAYPTFADGHREVALCEAILSSHKTESWVAVS